MLNGRYQLSCQRNFVNYFLNNNDVNLTLWDIGSGGDLKYPWNLIGDKNLKKVAFEPVDNNLPLCISNKSGEADFFVAHDERSSSLHEFDYSFGDRFHQWKVIAPKKTIKVSCDTLDNLIGENDIDLVDINVEGHDYYVLEGAEKTLQKHWVKLIKIEFENALCWKDQRNYGDIDIKLRELGYEMIDIEYSYIKPTVVSGLNFKGEPVWGKAYYVKSKQGIAEYLDKEKDESVLHEVKKTMAIYGAIGALGKINDLFDYLEKRNIKSELSKEGVFNFFQRKGLFGRVLHLIKEM